MLLSSPRDNQSRYESLYNAVCGNTVNSLNPDRLIELQNCHSTESVINALKKYDIEAAPNEAQMIMDFVKGEPVSDSSNEWFEIFLRYCNS